MNTFIASDISVLEERKKNLNETDLENMRWAEMPILDNNTVYNMIPSERQNYLTNYIKLALAVNDYNEWLRRNFFVKHYSFFLKFIAAVYGKQSNLYKYNAKNFNITMTNAVVFARKAVNKYFVFEKESDRRSEQRSRRLAIKQAKENLAKIGLIFKENTNRLIALEESLYREGMVVLHHAGYVEIDKNLVFSRLRTLEYKYNLNSANFEKN